MGKDNFDVTDEGSTDKQLGIDIKKFSNDLHELRKMHLIQRIIDYLKLDSVETKKKTNFTLQTSLAQRPQMQT